MGKKLIATLFILPFILNTLPAQDIENWIEEQEKVPIEKIYLQTSSDYCFHNDTLWFKVYITDSRSGRLIPGAENIYISLIDKTGQAVQQSVLMSINGQASGNMAIPDTLKTGNFLLQAATDYLQNFGSKAFFHKTIHISRPAASAVSPSGSSGTMVADVSFMPEGGLLLENSTNLIAFKAINKNGYGVNAKGNVKDEKGVTVTSFSTDYNGMGLFFLTPEPGKSYYAQINGFPSFRYNFKIEKEGIKIQLVNHTNKKIILHIAGNSVNFSGKTFHLATMHEGQVLFYHTFQMDGINMVLKFKSDLLKPGINRLVLLDENLKPLSERLLFSTAIQINHLQVKTNAETLPVRSEVILEISNSHKMPDNELSNLSVAVKNSLAVKEITQSKDILSHLLIDSDLNGFVENSADLFIDNNISSQAKLRLLMLVNGWSSYLWNTIPKHTEKLSYNRKAGLDLSGTALNILTDKPLDKGEVTLVVQKDEETAFLFQKTDYQGRFAFPGLLFNDTATIYMQAKNSKGKTNTSIKLNSFYDPLVTKKMQKRLGENFLFPKELMKLGYQSHIAKRKYKPYLAKNRKRNGQESTGDIENETHFKLYDRADFVLEIEENTESYDNILDYMAGKVPGMDISSDQVRIRGTATFSTKSSPLFLIDGIPLISSEHNISEHLNSREEEVEQEDLRTDYNEEAKQIMQSVRAIPLNDVERIEVLKSPQNLAIFGVNGANGVIAIYMRKGRSESENISGKGVLEAKIAGFASVKQFYSPKYTPENIKDKQPDYRTTLYWNPDVAVGNDKTVLRFFTSDETGTYKIKIEGITNNGIICTGEGFLEVNAKKK